MFHLNIYRLMSSCLDASLYLHIHQTYVGHHGRQGTVKDDEREIL